MCGWKVGQEGQGESGLCVKVEILSRGGADQSPSQSQRANWTVCWMAGRSSVSGKAHWEVQGWTWGWVKSLRG